MTAVSQDFTLYAGDAGNPIFQVLNQAGGAIDISTVSDIVWSAQQSLLAPTVILKRFALGQITFVTDGTDGQFTVAILGTDTSPLAGYYLHEAQIVDGLGNVSTVTLGRFQVGRAPSWSYSGNPASSTKDQVRFYVQDTDESDQQLADEEIAWALAERGSTWGASAMCCLALQAKYSRLTSISADGVSQGLQQRAVAYGLMAKEFQRKEVIYRAMPTVGGISKTDMLTVLSNSDRVPDIFRIAMNDNPPNSGVDPVNDPPVGSDDPEFF